MLKGLRRRLAIIFTAFTGAVLTAVVGVSFYQSATQTQTNRDLWFSSTVDRVVSTVMTNAMNEEQTGIYEGEYIVCVMQNGQVVQGLLAEEAEAGQMAAPVSDGERQAMFTQAKSIAEERGLTGWVAESYRLSPALDLWSATGAVSARASDDLVEEAGDDTYVEGRTIVGSGSIAIAISPVLDTEGVFSMEYGGSRYRTTYFGWEMQTDIGEAQTAYEVAVMENLAGQTKQILLDGLWYVLVWLSGLGLLFLANWFLAKLVLHPTEEGLRRQTEFVAAASHELRSPLAVIRSSLSAAEGAEDAQQAEKFQTAAAEEAGRMSHLVDDLLLLAGGDAGSWQLQKAPVDLDTLLIDAAESYISLARDKGVQLKLDLPEETLPRVQGDAERLRQILAVLLDNALQYAPPNTEVTLSARARRGKVNITVADRGRGVPDDEKDKVFERFYRADKSRHDKAHFGLGLSVARELAELHKGQLAVSDTEDGGATFALVLPALPEER